MKWGQMIQNGGWEVFQKDLFELTFKQKHGYVYMTKSVSTTWKFSLE